jgi:transcriptional regulator with XRE-family HTH domain
MTGATDNDLRRKMIGRFLRQHRVKAHLTQHDVAQHLSYTSPQFVSNWERGVSLPPLEVLPRLSSLYGIPPKDVIDAVDKYQEAVMKRRKKLLAEIFRKDSRRV